MLKDIARKGWALTPLGGGYARVEGAMYAAYVVITDEVTEAERDDYLRLFSHRPAVPGEATHWLRQWMKEAKMKQPDMEDLPGFAELFRKSLRKALDEMPVEERLEGLAPEQRLAGLATEEVILALPVEVLQMLSEEHVRSLPADVQETIRKRLQGAAH